MYDENPDYLIWSASSVSARNYRTTYIRRFMRQPVMSREALLAVALWRQLDRGERNCVDNSFPEQETAIRPQPTDEEVRFHVGLSNRLMALNRERYGLWPRIRRFLFRRW
jgi:hypothetical protein